MGTMFPAMTFLLVIAATPVWACDVPFVTLPKDLVNLAEVIVRARAMDEDNPSATASASVSPVSRHIQFSIVSVLKGKFTERTIRIPGYLDDRDDWNPNPDPANGSPRPGFLAGSCHSMNYRRGADYLLFLSHTLETNSLTPYWVSLARTNEQLRGDGDTWLAWVLRELRQP